METVLIQLFMFLLNVACVIWGYYLKNYKTAIFNGFAAGVCFMRFIYALYNLAK